MLQLSGSAELGSALAGSEAEDGRVLEIWTRPLFCSALSLLSPSSRGALGVDFLDRTGSGCWRAAESMDDIDFSVVQAPSENCFSGMLDF